MSHSDPSPVHKELGSTYPPTPPHPETILADKIVIRDVRLTYRSSEAPRCLCGTFLDLGRCTSVDKEK